MMFGEGLVRRAGFVQAERPVHVDFKWTSIDQRIESLDKRRVEFPVVRFKPDTLRSGRLGHYAVWIRDTSAFANRRKCSISFIASRCNQRGVDSIGRELPGGAQNILASSVDSFVSSEFGDELHTIIARSYRKHPRAETLREL